MKAAVFIKDIRDSNQRLWDSYQTFLSTNGEQGMNCFTPDKMESLLKRTDREIIELGLAKGVVIEDAEEYLAGIEK